jgi:hypothetical protein
MEKKTSCSVMISVLGLAISCGAAIFTGWSWWDRHREVEARLTPNERLLLVSAEMIEPSDESERSYSFYLCNTGNRPMTLCDAMIRVAPVGKIPQYARLLPHEISIPPGEVRTVTINVPFALPDTSPFIVGENPASSPIIQLALTAVSAEGRAFSFVHTEETNVIGSKVPFLKGFHYVRKPFTECATGNVVFLSPIKPARPPK